MIIEYKSKKDFFFKFFLLLSILEGITIAMIWYIIMNKEILKLFLNWFFLGCIIIFIIVSSVSSYFLCNFLWKRDIEKYNKTI